MCTVIGARAPGWVPVCECKRASCRELTEILPGFRGRAHAQPGPCILSLMTEHKKRDGKDGSWNWAYLIPILGLMIPIFAVTNVDLTEILTSVMAAVIAAIGAGTVAGRYLLGYRHQLRMSELEAHREVAALESRQLTEAQRLLDLDDRLDELRLSPETNPPAEA